MSLTGPEQDTSTRFAVRATNLLSNHPWLDSQTAVTLAQQPTPDDQMHAQAAAMGQQLAQTWDGYEQRFYDPVLQTQPSQTQAQVAYVHQTLGPPPATTGITDLQTALNQDGFLKSAPSGVWDSETENAYNQAVNALKNQQFAGAPKKGGNPFTSTVSSLYHAVIHDVTHPWDAATGWYDSVRQAVGDIAGVEYGLATNPTEHMSNPGSSSARVASDVVNALGGHETAAQQGKEYHNPLNAVADALAVTGATSVVKGVGKGVAAQAAKQTAAQIARDESEAASRGTITDAAAQKLAKVGAAMSTAQKMGFVGRSINDIGDALRAGTLPASDPLVKRNLGIITKTLLKTPARIIGEGPVSAGFAVNTAGDAEQIFSKAWRDNVPGLARLAPAAAKLAGAADEGGWAYTIRNVIASPYRLAPVRAAGIAAQRAEMGSLAAHGVANLLPDTQLQHNVDAAQHNVLDSWVDNTRINVLPGVSIGPEDFLLGPLHGDLTGAGKGSAVIGDAMDHFLGNLNAHLGDTGVIAAFEHTTGLTYADLLKSVGGDSAGLQTWMRDHQNTAASDAYAIRQLGHTPAFGDAGEATQLKALRDQWFKLPEDQQRAWLADYTKADTHLQYLRNYLDSSFLRDSVSKEARQAATKTDLKTYLDTQKLGQDFMRSGAAHFVIGPNGQKALEDIPPWETGRTAPSINRELPGSIGLQKVTSKTSTDVLEPGGDLAKLKAEYAALPDEFGAKGKFADKLIGYLHTHFNLDAVRLQVLGTNPDRLLGAIGENASHLAADVMPTWDQPQWVRDKLAAINAQGYKLVVGSHIGHALDDTLPDLGPIDGHLTGLRKFAGNLGLDPGRVPDTQVSQALRNNIMSKIHGVIRDDPKVQLATPHADVRTVMAVLHNGVEHGLNPLASGLFNATSKIGADLNIAGKKVTAETLNASQVRVLAKTKYAGVANAEDLARSELEHSIAASVGLRDIPHAAAMKALTEDHTIELPSGATFDWKGVEAYTAKRILQAVNEGYRLPGYMMGWQGIENWARAGFRIGKFDFTRDQPLSSTVARWTNGLVQARNAARFTMSPVFSARRAFKQNYKMGLELGRPVNVWNPLLDLEKNGELEQAQKLLAKFTGQAPGKELEADLYMRSADIYGIYNGQWTSAWFLNELHKRGDTPEQMKEAYDRVFKYGAHGGQTALERTANTIFFPFSFEKTLLRNTGAYLADRPGQALLLAAGVDAYRQADQNGQIGQWVNDHLPLLNELQVLNGFAHGISPGQLGGINAPLFNMFLPQMWGASTTTPNLKKFIPLWNEMGALFKNVNQQASIAGAAGHDAIRSVLKHNWKPEPALTDQAQISYALRAKASMISNPGVKNVIDYNAGQSSDADKYTWPENSSLPTTIWDKPVDKTTIAAYVQYLYPAYDPNSGEAYAKSQAAALDGFIRKVGETDPAKAQQLQAFRQVADQVVAHINRDDYDAATQAQVQNEFAQGAAQIAKNDPVFKKLYDTFYAYALSPILSPAQKANAA